MGCEAEAEASGVDPIREEYCLTRELSDVAGPAGRLELSLGVGLTVLDGVELGAVAPTDGLGWACISRRRVAIRSAIDCRLASLCADTPGVESIRKDLGASLDLMEGLGTLGLTDGPGRLKDGLWLGADGRG